MSSLTEWLEQHDACAEGVDFARGKTPREAWEGCQRPDWLLWALEKLGYEDQRVLRMFACRCVRQVWHRLPAGPLRDAVKVAERYADGKATAEELAAVRAAAKDAAKDAARDAAGAAAGAAAAATPRAAVKNAAWNSVVAAALDVTEAAARDAALDAALDATWATARGAAWDATRSSQAGLLRELVPVDVAAELFERMIRGD